MPSSDQKAHGMRKFQSYDKSISIESNYQAGGSFYYSNAPQEHAVTKRNEK
jgi:hypothetical protein